MSLWMFKNNISWTEYIYIHAHTHTHTHTAAQKFGISKIFLMFFKEMSYAHQGCIYLIKIQKNTCNFVKYYGNLNNRFLFMKRVSFSVSKELQ